MCNLQVSDKRDKNFIKFIYIFSIWGKPVICLSKEDFHPKNAPLQKEYFPQGHLSYQLEFCCCSFSELRMLKCNTSCYNLISENSGEMGHNTWSIYRQCLKQNYYEILAIFLIG